MSQILKEVFGPHALLNHVKTKHNISQALQYIIDFDCLLSIKKVCRGDDVKGEFRDASNHYEELLVIPIASEYIETQNLCLMHSFSGMFNEFRTVLLS